MELRDISTRMKAAREAQSEGQGRVIDAAESFLIRAKMVGVLLRDARLNAKRSVEECARLVHVAPDQIERWELGDETPTLPQLELLAYVLGVPVSHFWGTTTLESEQTDVGKMRDEYLALRDRMIGALLRKAREEASMSLEDLAAFSGLSAEQINRYELGEQPLPMNELTVLANGVRKNLNYFLESGSHIGELLAQREAWKHFARLPEEIRQFASNPLNAGFIEIAIMLSQMPTDRLRRIGESILSITM